MKMKWMALLAGLVFLASCASTPKTSDMRQLFSMEVADFLAGKTFKVKTDYGQWAQYQDSKLLGAGKAWGSWGSETAKQQVTVMDSGEFCTRFEYDSQLEWTDPKYEYCSAIYQNDQGNFYIVSTKDTRKPERVGQVKLMEITSGDTLALMQ